MIGPGPRSYVYAYVDPVFTSQRYDISISINAREERTCPFFLWLLLILMSTQFSLAYT